MPRINTLKDFSKHSNKSARRIFRDSTTVCVLLCKRSSTPDKLYYASIETVYIIFERVDSKIPEHVCFSVVPLT